MAIGWLSIVTLAILVVLPARYWRAGALAVMALLCCSWLAFLAHSERTMATIATSLPFFAAILWSLRSADMQPKASNLVGAILSLAGVLVFAYGLVAGIALVIDGRRRWIALLPPLLLAAGFVLIWIGNRMQGWGLLRKRKCNQM